MKKEICMIIAGLLIVSNTAVYAASSESAGGTAEQSASNSPPVSESQAATEKKTSEMAVIKLSIKDAVKIMQTTGTRAETAELHKKSDQASARGYGETVNNISKVLKGLDLLDKYSSLGYVSASDLFEKSFEAQNAGATLTNKKVFILRRDFVSSQIENNYRAEMNQIEYDTLKAYYGVLLARENLKTEQNNLKAQEDILKSTKAQYQAGMLAKKDLLSAQSALTAAQSSVREAETKLEYAKMSFNYLLGYPVMQEVELTDDLNVVTAPAIDLDKSIQNALNKRNEIKGANFAVEVYKLLLEGLMGYPRTSSAYMEAQVALMSAEKQARDIPVQIEIELRNKAAALEDKMAALEAAKAVKAYAEEGYRLLKISYDAGMTTLAELQQAQSNVYKAGLGVSAAIADYDLAVYEFGYAQDVGTYRLSL